MMNCDNCSKNLLGAERGLPPIPCECDCEDYLSSLLNPTPPEFSARTGDREITGPQRDKMYQLFDSTIDKFLEDNDATD